MYQVPLSTYLKHIVFKENVAGASLKLWGPKEVRAKLFSPALAPAFSLSPSRSSPTS